VSVKQKDDPIHPLRHPLNHLREIVPTIRALLLAGQDARSVDDWNGLEYAIRKLRALKPIQERIAEPDEKVIKINLRLLKNQWVVLLNKHYV